MFRFRNWMTVLTVLISAMVVWTDTQAASEPTKTNRSGNQLMQGSTHWYEHAATTVGPVSEAAPKGGTLLTLQSGSVLYLEGDSTLHKYQMNANSLLGSAVVTAPGNNIVKALQAGKVKSMSLVIPVEKLKSRESGLDKNAYKALKSTEDPEIRFELVGETLKPGKEAGSYVMTAKGSLTVAGSSVPVTLTADTTVTGDQIRLKGVQKLKMTDFKVSPPSISILVASITCTDEIEIHFDVIFAPKGEARTEAKK